MARILRLRPPRLPIQRRRATLLLPCSIHQVFDRRRRIARAAEELILVREPEIHHPLAQAVEVAGMLFELEGKGVKLVRRQSFGIHGRESGGAGGV